LFVEAHVGVRGGVVVGKCRFLGGSSSERDLNRKSRRQGQQRIMGVKWERGTESVFGGLEAITKSVSRRLDVIEFTTYVCGGGLMR
jgi:hypothetical protein